MHLILLIKTSLVTEFVKFKVETSHSPNLKFRFQDYVPYLQCLLESDKRELKQMEPILNSGDFTTYTVLSFEAS